MNKLIELIAATTPAIPDEIVQRLKERFAELLTAAGADENSIEAEKIAAQVMAEFAEQYAAGAEAGAEVDAEVDAEAGAEIGAGAWEDLSYEARAGMVRAAWATQSEAEVIEVFPDYIIISEDDNLARVTYQAVGDSITFAEPERVRVRYETVKDGASVFDFSQLAVKSVESGIVAGLMIPYYGCFFPDGQNVKEKGRDFQGQYFDDKSKVGLDLYTQRPVFYRHGLDPAVQRRAVGVVYTKSLRQTPAGIWGQAQLILSDAYRSEIDKLIAQGKIYFSSGAAPNLVEIDPLTGHIKEWLFSEVSLTPTPANLLAGAGLKDNQATTASAAWTSQHLAIAEFVKQLRDRQSELNELKVKEGRVLSSKVRGLLENAEREIRQALDAILELLNATQPTVETAKELYNIAIKESDMSIKALIQETVAEMQAADAAEAQAAAARQAEIDAAVQKALQEAGVSKATAAVKDNMIPPAATTQIQLTTPFDYFDPMTLGLGYMALRAKGKDVPQDYLRALGARMRQSIRADESFNTGVKSLDAARFGEYGGTFGAMRRRVGSVRLDARADAALKEFAIKADELLITTGSTYGTELVQTYVGREVIAEIQARVQLVALMNQREVGQGQSLPLYSITGDPTWYLTAETPDADQLGWSQAEFTGRVSRPTTGRKALDPEKITATFVVSGELTSQSVLSIVDELREKLIQSAAREVEWLVLNGHTETGATNISDYANGAIATSWHALALNGLRYNALVDGAGAKSRDGGVLAASDWIETRRLLGYRGEDEQTLAYVCDYEVTGLAAMNLAQFETVEKRGMDATVVSGKLVETYGSPFFATSRLPKTDANGRIHNTTGNNTKGTLICFRPDQCYVGYRRNLEIHQEYRFIPDATVLGARLEVDFQMGDEDAIGASYNLS